MSDKKDTAVLLKIIAGIATDEQMFNYIKPMLKEEDAERKEWEGLYEYKARLFGYAVYAACDDLAVLINRKRK